jgi:eukaryotic-like serine/threonine-protein kinase
MPDEPRVQELLAQLLDRQATPEEVCGACPELLPVVSERWRQICRARTELDALLPIRPAGSLPMMPPEELPLPQVPGYEVESVLGRGGMGVVYRARHLRLGRLVALKMALAGSCAGPHERERFRREAEAAAALRHPNVVQVYDVGDADGRPYFTMELMEGASLARKLSGAPQPARQAAALLATLAGAVQAAHEAGVVHRDLKPGNVLLTADGTPKVADFGLARRLDADERLTLSGAIIGTPGYAAPEQARGDRGAVGPRTDIYALGTILYECLTGRPPFRAGTAAATLQQVVADEPVAPRRLNPSVPRDLETVCLKCLHKEPRQRYASAAELADDLRRFERGEPIAARRVGVLGSVRKWARRRPAAAAMLVAVALVAAVVAVSIWLLVQQRADVRARQDRTDLEVQAILGLARVKLDDGWKAADLEKLADARAEAARADDVARGGASAPVRQEAESFREQAAHRLARAQANRALTEALVDLSGPQSSKEYTRDESGQWKLIAGRDMDGQYAAAFRHWGLDVDGAAEAEVVAQLAAEPEPVVQELIAALDMWALWRRQYRSGSDWRRLFRVVDQLDRSDRRRRFRGLLREGLSLGAEDVARMVGAMSPWQTLWKLQLRRGITSLRLRELRREIDPRTEPILTVSLLARMFVTAQDAASAEEVLFLASTAHPREVLLLHRLGSLLAEQGPPRLEESIGYYRAARSLQPRLGVSLSDALIDAGRPSQAEAVMQELLSQRPGQPEYLAHLGIALVAQRRFGDAEATYRQIIALDPDFVEAYCNLGTVLSDQGRSKEAEQAYRDAIKLKPDLAEAHNYLGLTLFRQDRPREAEQAFRDAIRLKPDHADAHNSLGTVLSAQGRPKEAEQAFRDAIKLKPDHDKAHYNLGIALGRQNRPREAEQAYRDAIRLKPDYALAHYNLGIALGRQGRPREAEEASRDAIKFKPDYAEAHNNLGNALTLQGRSREAERAYRDAIKFKPDYAEAHHNLGTVLNDQRRPREAEQAFRDAIKFKPDLAEAHNYLGIALGRQDRHKEAERAYRDAIKLKPAYADPYNNLGVALRSQGRPREAEQAFRDAIKLKPDHAQAHNNLGVSLIGQGRHKEAERACRDAIRVKPDYAEAHYNLGGALRAQGMFEEALKSFHRCATLFPSGSRVGQVTQQLIAETERLIKLDAQLTEVLAGKGEKASPPEKIQLAALAQQPYRAFYRAAVSLYSEAFAAQPALEARHRYAAACAAALTSCGQGKAAADLDDTERARWRRQALEWLRLDLASWGKALDGSKGQARAQVRARLQHWRSDDDFAGVRGADALARIPAEERKEWERFWAEVDALIRRASEPDE